MSCNISGLSHLPRHCSPQMVYKEDQRLTEETLEVGVPCPGPLLQAPTSLRSEGSGNHWSSCLLGPWTGNSCG